MKIQPTNELESGITSYFNPTTEPFYCPIFENNLLVPGSEDLLERAAKLEGREQIHTLMQVVRANLTFAQYEINAPADFRTNCVGAALTTYALLARNGYNVNLMLTPRMAWSNLYSNPHVLVACMQSSGFITTDATPLPEYGYGQTSQLIPYNTLLVNVDGEISHKSFDLQNPDDVCNKIFPSYVLLDLEDIQYIQDIWIASVLVESGRFDEAIKLLLPSDERGLFIYEIRKLFLLYKCHLENGDKEVALSIISDIAHRPDARLSYIKEYFRIVSPKDDPELYTEFTNRKNLSAINEKTYISTFKRHAEKFRLDPVKRAHFMAAAMQIDPDLRKQKTVRIFGKDVDLNDLNPRELSQLSGTPRKNYIKEYERIVFELAEEQLVSNAYI